MQYLVIGIEYVNGYQSFGSNHEIISETDSSFSQTN